MNGFLKENDGIYKVKNSFKLELFVSVERLNNVSKLKKYNNQLNEFSIFEGASRVAFKLLNMESHGEEKGEIDHIKI
jgi:hypothetical protein